MSIRFIIALLLITSLMPSNKSTTEVGVAQTPGCSYSSLWGVNGEKWKPTGRLPDFSYAGYHAGEMPIPKGPANWDLKRDFKAKGDGESDDSDALLDAVQNIKRGVLFIPEGTYVIGKRIDIARGNLVLRGAGPNKTILLFPKSLTDLFGNKAKENETSEWSFRPGLFNISGKDPINGSTLLASVTAPAKRGDKTLRLSKQITVKKGEWLRLVESDPPKESDATGSLIRYLYGELMPPGDDLLGTRHVVRSLSRARSVSGNTIELERPLPYDVRAEWKPEIHRFAPSVQEFGLEHLSIHFPWSPYLGHFREKGYNGVFLLSVTNCWIRDVEIQNSDFGVDLNSTNFCTVENVVLTTSKSRAVETSARGANGHHGIDVSHGTENLVTNFDLRTQFVHDVSVEWYALHTVFSNGRGINLNMDHHREANYSTLFSNLDCGEGKRPFDSGGSSNRGAHSGAYSTFWNVHAAGGMKYPPQDFGPLLNFIGFRSSSSDASSLYQWFIELQGKRVCPAELHEAMRAKRVKR